MSIINPFLFEEPDRSYFNDVLLNGIRAELTKNELELLKRDRRPRERRHARDLGAAGGAGVRPIERWRRDAHMTRPEDNPLAQGNLRIANLGNDGHG